MASFAHLLITEYEKERDLTNHHANCVVKLWPEIREKNLEQCRAMEKILTAQRVFTKKFKALHLSLKETSDQLTQTLLEQQSQLPAPDSPLPNITIESFYGLAQPENVPHPTITADPTLPEGSNSSSTQQQQ
jgi:hypothetical protein